MFPILPSQLLSVEVESHKAHKAAVETQLLQMEKEFSAAREELQRLRQDDDRDKASAKVQEETRNILLELERERGRLAGLTRSDTSPNLVLLLLLYA